MCYCILPLYGVHGYVFSAVNFGIKGQGAVWACRVDLAAHNRHLVYLIDNKSKQIKIPAQLPRLVTFTHGSSCLWRGCLPNCGCCQDMCHRPIFLPKYSLLRVAFWQCLHQGKLKCILEMISLDIHRGWRVMKKPTFNCAHPECWVYGVPSAIRNITLLTIDRNETLVTHARNMIC